VKACNSHEELLSALEFFAQLNPNHYKDIQGGIIKAQELLTKIKNQ
jgi:hypothetical protein